MHRSIDLGDRPPFPPRERLSSVSTERHLLLPPKNDSFAQIKLDEEEPQRAVLRIDDELFECLFGQLFVHVGVIKIEPVLYFAAGCTVTATKCFEKKSSASVALTMCCLA